MAPTMKPYARKAARSALYLTGLAIVSAVACGAAPALASEGGASVYLLGSGGPGAGELPPIEGVFFANTAYHYSGKASAEKKFPVGGNLVAGLKATINADFATVLWVPTTDFEGGTLAIGAALPVGVPDASVSAVISGPGGGQASITRGEDKLIVGDPLVTAALGWKVGDVAIQASSLVNIPIGDYRAGHLSNLAFHRWALDTSLAATWKSKAGGWDVSGKTGFIFNGENESTNYRTGTEWHVEAAVEKSFSPSFSAGVQAYYYDQMSDDSGSGATLGGFKGQVTGVGATAAYNFKIGHRPATLRLHAMTEFAAKNRLEGDAVWLDFSVPLWMNLPAGAGS